MIEENPAAEAQYLDAVVDMNLLLEIERSLKGIVALTRKMSQKLKHANIADALDDLAGAIQDEILSGALYEAKAGPRETIDDYRGGQEDEGRRQLRSDYLWLTRP